MEAQKNDDANHASPRTTADYKEAIASVLRPYSWSPIPAWTLATLFLTTSIAPRSPLLPPLMQRVAFSAIFAGAGYVLSAGDARNGSGITTAWSLTYLFLNMRKSLTRPRHPVSLALTSVTMASATLYGTEYFVLQDDSESTSEHH